MDRPRRRAAVELRRMFDGSALLFEPSSGRTYALNESGAAVWELCDGRRTPRAIAAALRERYAAGHDEAAESVAELIARLRQIGVLDASLTPHDGDAGRLRRRYELLGFRVEVASNSAALRAALDRLNANLRDVSTRPPHVRYQAIRDNGEWDLRFEGRELPRARGLLDAVSYLEWHMCRRAIEHCRDRLHVHGAALGARRGSVLVAGHGGIGKTTLALGLALRGLHLFADDVVFLRPGVWRPEPFPRSPHLHDDALSLLRPLGLRYRRRERLGGYLCATALRWARAAGPPIRHVVFPRPSADARPSLRPISRAEAALELLDCSTHLPAGPDGLEVLSRLLRDARCYLLRRNDDLAASVELVHRLVKEDE